MAEALTEAPLSSRTDVIDCAGRTTREVNGELRRLVAEGAREVVLANPAARHSLAVALKADGVRIIFDGPAGWYAAGMNLGPHVEIRGNCGWGLAECMMSGHVEVHGHAGSGAAASIRGGLVHVRGDAGARAGIAMKGGALVVEGNVGYMTGFMMQRGTIVVCGDAAEGLGDSMYEGAIYVGGDVEAYGADAVEHELTRDDHAAVGNLLDPMGIDAGTFVFKKVMSGRKLWNFSTKEPELWKTAL